MEMVDDGEERQQKVDGLSVGTYTISPCSLKGVVRMHKCPNYVHVYYTMVPIAVHLLYTVQRCVCSKPYLFS